MEQENKRTKSFKIAVVTLIILAVALAALLNAAYIKNTAQVKNTFKPADTTIPKITEEFDGNLKEDVYFEISNIDYPVYVRAKIVITWQNEEGNVYYKPVDDEYYELILNDTDWELIDGYYYYNDVVESGNPTSNLIESCRQLLPAPEEGYTLSVEIIVQTIQAVGYTDDSTDENQTPAWEDADWSVPQ